MTMSTMAPQMLVIGSPICSRRWIVNMVRRFTWSSFTGWRKCAVDGAMRVSATYGMRGVLKRRVGMCTWADGGWSIAQRTGGMREPAVQHHWKMWPTGHPISS